MVFKLEGREKEIRIPDGDIKRIEKGLGVSTAEAIDIWLEDEGYLENEEQEQLCKKAKENRVTATIHQAKADGVEKKKRVVERKENPTKEGIISLLAQTLKDNGYDNVMITNVGKIIEFNANGETFKLDLIQRRKQK